MPQTIKITRDITSPVSENVATGINRFSSCSTTKKTAKTSGCGCTIQDIKWYPDTSKLVVVKLNQPDLTVDISAVVGDQTKTTSNIRIGVWNPDKQPEPGYDEQVLVAKNTDFTTALQTIVDNVSNDTSNIFKVNVTKVIKDVVPTMDCFTKFDITARIYDPQTEQLENTVIVEQNTEITNALQTVVDKLRVWDVWS